MPEFYMIIAWKIFSPNFGTGDRVPLSPVFYAYVWQSFWGYNDDTPGARGHLHARECHAVCHLI